MFAFINDNKVEIFYNSTIKDLITSYSLNQLNLILAKDLIVIDSDGDIVDINGSIDEGDSFYIIENKKHNLNKT